MALSNEIISQFAKITKDDAEQKTESTVYGTTVEYNGAIYVRIDGSDRLTPVSTTADAKPDERVTVMIKNHTATITGNMSSPSARTHDVQEIGNKISEFEIVVADKVSTKELDAQKARIDNLQADNVTIKENLTAQSAEIVNLQAKDVDISEKLNANEADIEKLKTDKLDATSADIKYAKVGDLDVTNATIHNLQGTYADFQTTTTNRFAANEADITKLQADKLDATSAEVKYANIDFSNIDKATMEYFYANSGLIKNVTIGDSSITGELVGVTIKGDLIEGNTIVAEKLVIKGEDGLYYKLNTDGGATVSEEITKEKLQNGLSGSIIIAKSITAEKIRVQDLVAFGATIGGFHITDSSLYSGVKESVDNTTRGIYLDNLGQIAIGDSSSFLKYYKDQNGNYKLEVSAERISFGTGRKNIEKAINEVIDSGRNLYIVERSEEGYLVATDSIDLAPMDAIRKEHTSEHIPVSPGEQYVIQSWVTVSEEDTSDPIAWLAYRFFDSEKQILSERVANRLTVTSDDRKCHDMFKITAPAGAAYIRVSARFYNDGLVKFERGNTPTEWSPAPEDIQNDMSALDKSVYDLSETTDDSVRNINEALEDCAKNSELTQLDSSVKARFEQTDESVRISFEGVQTTLNKHGKTITDVGDNFEFTTDGLKIGNKESPYKMSLTESELSMNLEVGDVTKQIITLDSETESAVIPTLKTSKRFELCGYVIEEDENGYLNCEYVGG